MTKAKPKPHDEWSTRVELVVPDFDLPGIALAAGEWLVRRGAPVRAGDRVLEIVAGEVLIDLSAPTAGVLAERLVEANEPVTIGQVVGAIVAE